MTFAYLMGLALILGFKHSYDADHLVAVSTILRRVRSISSAMKIGASWAAGHMFTAAIVTTLLYVFKDSVLSAVLSHFEMAAGVMLIALGIFSLWGLIRYDKRHLHADREHAHLSLDLGEGMEHEHRYMFGIGIVHGLASNDELLILFAASLGITTLGGLLAGVGVFSIGVVLGMIVFCVAFSIPWLRVRSDASYRLLSGALGALSISLGASMLLTT